MDLLQLRYFCHAAQTENFSKTAEAFFVPASNVSQTIKRLENELGMRLFHRTPNRITLNRAGTAFYEKIRRALDFIDEAKQEIEVSKNGTMGTVKILAYTCRRIVTQAVEAFKNRFPQVAFVIHHKPETVKNDYDIIVSDREFPCRLSRKKLLISEKIALACNNLHPLASIPKITRKHLFEKEFIAMSAGNSLHDILMQINQQESLSLKITIQSDDPFYVKKYLDENLGLAFVPMISWRGTFTEKVIFKPFGDYTRNTFVWHDDPAYMPDIHKTFLSFLQNSFEKETLLDD